MVERNQDPTTSTTLAADTSTSTTHAADTSTSTTSAPIEYDCNDVEQNFKNEKYKCARCGKKLGGRCCGKGRYYSKWNWCGTSKLHKRIQQRKYSNFVLKKPHNHKCRKLEKGARCCKKFSGRCCGKGRYCSK